MHAAPKPQPRHSRRAVPPLESLILPGYSSAGEGGNILSISRPSAPSTKTTSKEAASRLPLEDRLSINRAVGESQVSTAVAERASRALADRAAKALADRMTGAASAQRLPLAAVTERPVRVAADVPLPKATRSELEADLSRVSCLKV